MNQTQKMKRTQMEKQADELAAMEIVTETNSGTYGGAEAVRTCGTADPQFADYRVFTRVGDGRERREGCDAARSPGYARKFRIELSDAQKQLADLRREIRAGQGAR